MAHPDQANSPQGSLRVSTDSLAADGPGIGSGWQQSQNWALLAAAGQCARTGCSVLCAEDLT